MKRNRKGRFMRSLPSTDDESREFLIWSLKWNAWHCRGEDGGARGYTSDLWRAGLFERSTASAYHDGEINEAFHVSEQLELIGSGLRQHAQALESLRAMVAAVAHYRASSPQPSPTTPAS